MLTEVLDPCALRLRLYSWRVPLGAPWVQVTTWHEQLITPLYSVLHAAVTRRPPGFTEIACQKGVAGARVWTGSLFDDQSERMLRLGSVLRLIALRLVASCGWSVRCG